MKTFKEIITEEKSNEVILEKLDERIKFIQDFYKKRTGLNIIVKKANTTDYWRFTAFTKTGIDVGFTEIKLGPDSLFWLRGHVNGVFDTDGMKKVDKDLEKIIKKKFGSAWTGGKPSK